MNGLQEIAKAAARLLHNRKLDQLSKAELELLSLLESSRYIIPNKPVNGFAGHVMTGQELDASQ